VSWEENLSHSCFATAYTGGIAVKKLMEKDGISGLTFSCAGTLVYPPATQYSLTPTYQDQVAMFFDWILMNWKEKRKPRFGWISPDNPFGKRWCQTRD